jgi:RNA polymerase sigma-70 factor, ECF subfamily
MNPREPVEEVRRVMAGDAEALQRLIVHYHGVLGGIIAAAIDPGLRPYIDPDDVLQEAYASAFKTLAPPSERERAIEATSAGPHFDGPAGFYKWLEQIALNQLRDAERALRRQKRDVRREVAGRPTPTGSYADLAQRVTASDPTPSRRIARNEAVVAVMTCLARLSDDQRAVVRLRILEGVPSAEIAERLGKTEPAIHGLCIRGLRRLQELMGPITQYLTSL